ncbi:MAG: alpha-ketoglutarate-dependent dioxygenase AlkB [Anaerolineae bacterium]|nr:alpha-ketoglutarate-dependent dioxygenase AlkB [Gemmatimonadaceae bacterium]
MTQKQLTLFGAGPAMPQGFSYRPDVLTPDAERNLLLQLKDLPLRDFEFQGYTAKRRVISYGWQYDFNERALRKTNDIPSFLLSLREVAAAFGEVLADELQQVLVTEYDAGAGIGWHRDKAVFGDVIGVSLLSSCIFRMRRKAGTTWERASITADPRSVYLLRGSSRTEWEHSIPPVDTKRYSITFRNFREGR